MHRSISTVFLAIGLLAFVGACQSGSQGSQTTSQVGRDTVTVTMSQNGGRIRLQQGQTLLVQLPESAARGLTWEMEAMPDQSVLMPNGQRHLRSQEQAEYGSLLSDQELRFQAVGPGTTTVSLAYDRPGGGEATVQSRFSVSVVVD